MVEGRRRRKLFGYSRLLSAAASAEAATSTTSCSNRARGWFWVGESPNLNALITTTKGERFFPLWVGAKTYFVTLSLSLSPSLPFPPGVGKGGKRRKLGIHGMLGRGKATHSRGQRMREYSGIPNLALSSRYTHSHPIPTVSCPEYFHALSCFPNFSSFRKNLTSRSRKCMFFFPISLEIKWTRTCNRFPKKYQNIDDFLGLS